MNFVENSSFSHPVYAAYLPTPLGEMLAMSSDAGVCLLAFLDEKGFEKECVAVQNAKRAHLVWQDNAHLSILREELREYFSGSLKDFSVPVDFVGTPFQQSVWRILQTIPYGKTISYLEQAHILANPKAVRAVASANGKNKISIIVPCHRVIGSNGKLTGYAGGLARKQALLNLECGD
ncbi:methylated-DNA--[protein]-cysteine S-methyltransferase [Simonsiella muelleri]|jgi:hypothetical protein|uniref:Methylated-DNA--protein-cysteine methyltransferase n=1 Tax=Simonsiella muelleri ATCC 29453 TaxID=641147 RepID=V9HDU1_9NEIS|nr:methylated-DNA--[protein]-cysteine S-methyltransferase [Simonsiella muelleri]AUX60671.1 cysteine methyltransferase [Simonsiella muelleri ATCC 29453]EFG31776.1 methylated-DNA-[protein]-cysteine S-methyltransferase [Simonsiella muelleri ATCC 29453]UBQ54510.1 methylated-DNA--[protein]-cysteine S-methyltransferase [Simonsiella muelleri]